MRVNIYTPYFIERRKIIFEHLDKFPDAGTNTIAKILFRDYPGFFSDVENARDAIRYFRGAKGEKRRNKLSTKKYVRQPIPTTRELQGSV